MPQMAPLSWINLLITFIITFLVMNSLNYFSFQYKSSFNKKASTPKTVNWKW